MDDEDDPGVIPAVRHVDYVEELPPVAKEKRPVDDSGESPFDEAMKEEQLKELDDIVAMITVSSGTNSSKCLFNTPPPSPPSLHPVVQHLPFSPVVHQIPNPASTSNRDSMDLHQGDNPDDEPLSVSVHELIHPPTDEAVAVLDNDPAHAQHEEATHVPHEEPNHASKLVTMTGSSDEAISVPDNELMNITPKLETDLTIVDQDDDDGGYTDDDFDPIRSSWYPSCTPSYLPEAMRCNLPLSPVVPFRTTLDDIPSEDQEMSDPHDGDPHDGAPWSQCSASEMRAMSRSPVVVPKEDSIDEDVSRVVFVNEPIPVHETDFSVQGVKDAENIRDEASVGSNGRGSLDDQSEIDDHDKDVDEDDLLEELKRECSPVNSCLSEVGMMAGEIYTSVEVSILHQDSEIKVSEDASDDLETEKSAPTTITPNSEATPVSTLTPVFSGTPELVDSQLDESENECKDLQMIFPHPSEEEFSVHSEPLNTQEGLSQQLLLPMPETENDEVTDREMDFSLRDKELMAADKSDMELETPAIGGAHDSDDQLQVEQRNEEPSQGNELTGDEDSVDATDRILANAAFGAALLGFGPGLSPRQASKSAEELLVHPLQDHNPGETRAKTPSNTSSFSGTSQADASLDRIYPEDFITSLYSPKYSDMNLSRDGTVGTDANESRDEELGGEGEVFGEERSLPRESIIKPRTPKTWSLRCYIWICISIFALVVLVVTLGVVLGTKSSQSSSQTFPDEGSSPTSPTSSAERSIQFVQLVTEQSLADPALLVDDSSSEYMAMNWIIKDDPLALDPVDTSEHQRILQRYGLATLYFASPLGRWVTSNGWLEGNECDWFGITCDGGVVTKIEISSNNLTGTLSAEIAQLSSLTRMKISDNQLQGRIPTSLTNMSTLQTIDLSFNWLEDEFPKLNFQTLTVLQGINLRGNKMSGSIPSSLYTMTALTYVDLDSNFLTGTLSTRIGSLTNLNHLVMRGNAFAGSIPTEVGELQSMQVFDLSDNDLTGPIPTQIGNMREMLIFNAYKNALDGRIPPALGRLSKLETLRLEENQLSGILPDLGDLIALKELKLSVNELTGSIPDSLGNLVNLEILHLGDNLFDEDFFPEFVYDMVNLQELSLRNTVLIGSLDAAVGNLVNLVTLHVDGNSLNSTLPSAIGKLTKLRSLRLDNNAISGTIPTELGSLIKLTSLGMHWNSFDDTIPSQLSNLAELRLLDLSSNYIYGAIPTQLAQLRQLSVFICSDNFLSGTLPSNIGDWKELEYFICNLQRFDNVRQVGLTGSIPLSIGKLTKLKELSLFQNSLSGSIPSDLGSCSSLEILDLELNNFRGVVPSSIGMLSKVSTLRLGGNSGLSNPLPQSICDVDSLQVYRVDCNLTCACCTEACGSRSEVSAF